METTAPVRPAAASLDTLWGAAGLEGRFAVADLAVDYRTDETTVGAFDRPLVVLDGRIGAERFRLTVPALVADAILSRAAEPLGRRDLQPADGALVVEHLLAAPIAELEKRLGLPVVFGALDLAPEGGEPFGLPFRLRAAGRVFCGTLDLEDGPARTMLAALFGRHVAAAEAALRDRADAVVALGPIYLRLEELAELGPDDAILLENSGAGDLIGRVVLEDGRHAAAGVLNGRVTVTGPLRPPAAAGGDELLVEIGRARFPAPPRPGESAGVAPLEGEAVVVRHGAVRIGVGQLANIGSDLAVRILRMGIA